MNTLTLTSTRHGALRPLVEGALDNEARVLAVGIRKTQWSSVIPSAPPTLADGLDEIGRLFPLA